MGATMNKKQTRLRRARRTFLKIREIQVLRLCVHKTPRHMYAQIITADGGSTLVAASTLDDVLRKKKLKHTGNVEAATEVGKLLAQRAMEKGIKAVAFDRRGFLYHGRVKALADAARQEGLEF